MGLHDLAGDGPFLFSSGSNRLADFAITLSSDDDSGITVGIMTGAGDGDLRLERLGGLDFEHCCRRAPVFRANFLRMVL